MLYRKNIIIAIAALCAAGGIWFISRVSVENAVLYAPKEEMKSLPAPRAEEMLAPKFIATGASPTSPVIPARVALAGTTDFVYDIILGKTPCGDKIGTLEVQSSDPSAQLYWGMTGAMPIWLTFSQVQGKTPARVDMSFNCILSGAEDAIDWKFTVVEMTKEGKYVDGYARVFTLKGDIKTEGAPQ